MAEPAVAQPWEALSALAASGDAEALRLFIETLPPGEAARATSRLDDDERDAVLALLGPAAAAELLVEDMAEVQAADLIEDLEPAHAAAILGELAPSEQADVLYELDEDDAEAILAEMDPAVASAVRALAAYEPSTAGGLMATECLAYPSETSVEAAIADLRKHAETYAHYQVQYLYVVDAQGRLVGVVPLRDLILALPRKKLGDVMSPDPVSVADSASLDDLLDLFEETEFLGVPVVDSERRLVGLLRRSEVQAALAERSERDYGKAHGLVEEELRTMPLLHRSRRRLAWLSVNVVLNLISASVIALYQDTLAAVIALAAFLPIISDMSGCSGNQAVAVSMRELALGLVDPREVRRVWAKEIGLGLLNGVVLGFLVGGLGWLWHGNGWLGLVVGAALAANTVVAVSLGGTIPLILRRLGMDPALASGPILTTVTDLCGFFFALSLAAALLPRLVG